MPPKSTASAPATTNPLAALPPPVLSDLDQVEAILQREIRSQFPAVHRVLEYIQHYRGKRLRPVLLLLSARLCGPVRPEHYLLAAVLEMIHTATLIHDDILDGAQLRRHRPTVHSAWGVPAAILAGDFLLSHAFTLASQTGSTSACQLIGQVTNRLCEGEMLQSLQTPRFDLSEEEYFAIIRAKTAELISLACRLGAWFAHAPTDQIEALASFGLHLGLAFQIADDILDVIGDEPRMGKSLGTDWELAKPTLPFIYWLNSLPTQQRETYLEAWQQRRLTLRQLRQLLDQAGAIQWAWHQAWNQVHLAEQALVSFSHSPERQALIALAQFTVRRDF